ncbi:hypothetical protein MUK42_28504 [Musa troglodytarum]|uniref:Uncharacterized protein n=1 Tax=Musa troglodytarum TaxID=320322 RepID=A0A9E7JMK9_9LILI|nr:hypothetical protein MUK42_28504 [Musa troglodytarum]
MLSFWVAVGRRPLVHEEGPEAAHGDRGRHAPHDHRHGPRHDGRHLVGEHRDEERGEAPHRGPQPPVVGPLAAAFQGTETAEQEQEIGVGDDHEGHGRSVVPGAVDGRGGAICQEGKSQGGKPCVAILIRGGGGARWSRSTGSDKADGEFELLRKPKPTFIAQGVFRLKASTSKRWLVGNSYQLSR